MGKERQRTVIHKTVVQKKHLLHVKKVFNSGVKLASLEAITSQVSNPITLVMKQTDLH